MICYALFSANTGEAFLKEIPYNAFPESVISSDERPVRDAITGYQGPPLDIHEREPAPKRFGFRRPERGRAVRCAPSMRY